MHPPPSQTGWLITIGAVQHVWMMHWFWFFLEEGPGFYLISCTSPVSHMLTGTAEITQKLSMVRWACDTIEAVK
jgi:hypothetical protein